MGGVRVEIDMAAVQQLAQKVTREATEKAAAKSIARAKSNITRAGRVRTGALRGSIRILARRSSPSLMTANVGSDLRYAGWQERGVSGPIYPKRGKYLRFPSSRGRGYTYARKVRGFEGAHYMESTLNAVNVRDFL
jgi:hypothetical protein